MKLDLIRSVRCPDGSLSQSGGDTLVPWWSFSKVIIAAAILRLAEVGRLSLDACLPGEPFTARQLLQHRSGLGDYGEFASYHEAVARGDRAWTIDELLDRAAASRLRYPTGAGWGYSNIGYLKLRQAIEGVTGLAFGDALGKLVFEPAAMKLARVALDPAHLDAVEMGAVRHYDPAWVYHGLVAGPLDDATLSCTNC